MRKKISAVLAAVMIMTSAAAVFAEDTGKANICISTTVNGTNVTTKTVNGELVTAANGTPVKAAETVTGVENTDNTAAKAAVGTKTEIKPETETEGGFYRFFKAYIERCIRDYIRQHPDEIRKLIEETEAAEKAADVKTDTDSKTDTASGKSK